MHGVSVLASLAVSLGSAGQVYSVHCTVYTKLAKTETPSIFSISTQWSELGQSSFALCPHRQEISPVYGLASFMPLLSRLVKVIEPYMYIRARLRLTVDCSQNITVWRFRKVRLSNKQN